MTIEFLLGLVVLVVFGFGAMWLYAAVYDFVDYWKEKRLRREAAPAMIPDPWHTAPVEARLLPMAPAGRYGMDHEPPVGGPPVGHERRPTARKTAPWA